MTLFTNSEQKFQIVFDLLNYSECFLLENQIMSANSKEIQISDDILIDIFNFFGRKDHQYLNLVDQRFNILSEFVANRLTPRNSHILEVIGIRTRAGQFVGNTIVIHPDIYGIQSFCSEIPQVAPPNNLLLITALDINEFIDNELLQFLNVSRRLFVGCSLAFRDFDNFTRLHSMQFIRTFFGFFNENESIELWNVSKEAANLFRNPEILCGNNLFITCTENFDLNTLLDWLYFNGNNDGKKRILNIGFNKVHEGQQVEKALQFMESIAEDFIRSNSARNQFTIEIEIRDGPHIPNAPNLSMENPRTGETLTVVREYSVYSIVLRAKTNANDEQKEEEEEGMEPKSMIYIGDIIKGDIGE